MPHTCQKGIKRFITHIMRFSRESRAGSWEGLKMSERTENGAWLGVLWWLESGARVRIPLNGAGFAWFDLPTSAKEVTSGFPPSLPRCGTEGEVGLESYQKSNMKNGLTLYLLHYPKWGLHNFSKQHYLSWLVKGALLGYSFNNKTIPSLPFPEEQQDRATFLLLGCKKKKNSENYE